MLLQKWLRKTLAFVCKYFIWDFKLQMQWNSNICGWNVQVCFGITIYALVWKYDAFWF